MVLVILPLITLAVVTLTTDVTNAFRPVNHTHCGVYSADFHPDVDIEDSVHARPNEFPWQVQIEDVFGERVCSGAILDDQWLLAAASCVGQFEVNYLKPYAILERAYYRPTDPTPYRNTVIIERVIPHPEYDPVTLYRDFVLIKLHEHIPLAQWKMQEICLPDFGECDDRCGAGEQAFYVGWGRRTLTIQKAPVHIINGNDCDLFLENIFVGGESITRSRDQICSHGCIDMCWFASGSSLSIFDADSHKFFLCGIGSHMVNQRLCTALGPLNGPCDTGATGPERPLGWNQHRGSPRFRRDAQGSSVRYLTQRASRGNREGPTGIFSNVCDSLAWIQRRHNM